MAEQPSPAQHDQGRTMRYWVSSPCLPNQLPPLAILAIAGGCHFQRFPELTGTVSQSRPLPGLRQHLHGRADVSCEV